MKKYLLIVLVALSCSFHAQGIQKVIKVKTTLSKNDFFSYAITKIEFQPDSLTAIYNKDLATFSPLQTKLLVETNIPTANSDIEHVLNLTENSMTCFDTTQQELDAALTDGLVHVKVDGTDFTAQAPMQLAFNSSYEDSGNFFKQSELPFTLNFDVLPTEASVCRGRVAVVVEFNL